MARESGLTVSALRFYDSAGILPPADVDAATGYRWYADHQVAQARLIAALRRVRMPLPEIAAVLAATAGGTAGTGRGTTGEADRLLQAHLRRLENGLQDARRQLRLAHDLLEILEAPVTTFNVRGTDLADAIAAVRYAVGTDPDYPQLAGVLFDYDGTALRLVATDRHRLAVTTVPTAGTASAASAIVPLSIVDTWRLAGDTPAALTLGSDAAMYDGRRGPTITADYPDYRRLLRPAGTDQVTLTRADLRARVCTAPTRPDPDGNHVLALLRRTETGIDLVDDPRPGDIAVNREFLLQALDSTHAGQLTLSLDGPIAPLAFTTPETPHNVSLLMPVRFP
jgi:DNA-binding transcriptional MerR regulator